MSAPTRPNIVLITIDCWRGDHLGASGHRPSPTPHLDALALEGVTFDRAYTCGGWTRPAMMALMSSVYATHHSGGSIKRLSPDLPVLAEVLRDAGYATAGFTANPVCGRGGGFDRGFDAYDEPRSDQRLSQWWIKLSKIRGFGRVSGLFLRRKLTYRLLAMLRVPFRLPEVNAGARQLTDLALAWLEGATSPFFLWIHYIDLHWPYRMSRRRDVPADLAQAWRDRRTYRRVVASQGTYDAGEPTRERWRVLYREELLTVDEQIGRLLARLRESGAWDRTVVAATGDHGEEFYERGTWAHSWNQLFDEGVRVPLLVRAPGLQAGRGGPRPVSHLALAPTLLDLAGIEPPDTMRGASLCPQLADTNAADQTYEETITEMLGHRNSTGFRLSIHSDGHHYLYDIDRRQEKQLYDPATDPEERSNLYRTDDARSRDFDAHRLAHMAPIVPQLLEDVDELDALADVDPEVADRLQALGYIA